MFKQLLPLACLLLPITHCTESNQQNKKKPSGLEKNIHITLEVNNNQVQVEATTQVDTTTQVIATTKLPSKTNPSKQDHEDSEELIDDHTAFLKHACCGLEANEPIFDKNRNRKQPTNQNDPMKGFCIELVCPILWGTVAGFMTLWIIANH